MRPIDADKLKRTMAFTDAECLYDNNGKYLAEVIQLFQEKIDGQPTIEATPIITAKWEQAYNGYVCSNCHSHFTINAMGAGEFCSKCGAKMDKLIQFDFSNLKIEEEA